MEKIVVRNFIYPIFQDPSQAHLFSDQFAFRPTGSTEAALITILQSITNLLLTEPYVRLIALDFSKAFDTVRHSGLLAKMSELPINDEIFNWFVNYFQGHSHVTKFRGKVSGYASINASVFQGSVVGPPCFVINASDLKPCVPGNIFDKYAGDIILISPACNDNGLNSEMQSIELWAGTNNLTLNRSKSREIIIYAKTRGNAVSAIPTLVLEIERAKSMKILGVIIQDNLSMNDHVNAVCQSASQSLYDLKLLKAHGMSTLSVQSVCRATVQARLTYASPAWWGFATVTDRQKLQSVANRATRWGYYDKLSPTVEQICTKRDTDLFSVVLSNKHHVLHSLLPPPNTHEHNLKSRAHNRCLPRKDSSLIVKKIVIRMLYKNAY